LKSAVQNAPKGFGQEPEKYRYDVLFIKEPLTSKEAIKQIATKDGVDFATAGDNVIYFSRLIEQITKSQINKIVGSPIYKNITIRNWNTTTKLLTLIEL